MIYLPKPDFKDSTKDITKANHEVNGYYYTQPPFMGSYSDKLIAMWSSKFGMSCSAVNDLRDNILRDPEFRIYDVTMDAKKRNQRFNETVRPCDRMIHMPIYKDLSVSNKGEQKVLYVKNAYSAMSAIASRYPKRFWDLKLHKTPHAWNGKHHYNRNIASSKRGQLCRRYVQSKHGKDSIAFPVGLGFDKVRR